MATVVPVTGNTEFTRPENRAFYPALDGIRAIAFLMVFGQHYLTMPLGWTGVDLFFVLSGFLITGILFDSRDDRYRVRNFYIRRTLRIFPLYYGVLLALLLATPFVHWSLDKGDIAWPLYLGNFLRFVRPYTQNSPLQRAADFQPHGVIFGYPFVLYLGHFWSLCVEEQFYLLWPWVVFWVRDRRKLLWICAASLPICLAMRIAGQHLLPGWMVEGEAWQRVTPFRFDSLLIGGLIALWLRGPKPHALLRAGRMLAGPALAIALTWAFLLSPRLLEWNPYPMPGWMPTFGLSLMDIVFALVVVATLQPGTFFYRLFDRRPLRWLGRISYGLYVFHDIFHLFYLSAAAVLLPHLNPAFGASIIGLPTSIALAWLSWNLYESRFLNLKEKWTIRG